MKSLWNDAEAAQFPGDLGQRIYTSRLLGRDPALVLHGGGNTSVKIAERDLVGREETILYVKGSGGDLAKIDEAGFSPVRMERLLALAELPALPDPVMVNELRTHMTRASAPTPSVEAILHAILPFKFVDHTHADAVVTLTNSPDAAARVREVYGDELVVIPYVMPGFDLARACAERFAAEAKPKTIGMILMNHGIFSFGATARESYERMIALVGRAEAHLDAKGAWSLPVPPAAAHAAPFPRREVTSLRGAISRAAGFPMVLAVHDDARSLAFARRPDVAVVSQQGPATPQHAVYTKRVPMIARDVRAYAAAYRDYLDTYLGSEASSRMDAAPRILLDPQWGLCAFGRSPNEARLAADMYRHDIDIISRASAHGTYRAAPPAAIAQAEYEYGGFAVPGHD